MPDAETGLKIWPSHAETWMRCSAYPIATAGVGNNRDNENRITGLALHEVARTELLNPKPNLRELVGTSIVVDDKHSVILTGEMLVRVKMYLDFVRDTCVSGTEGHIEETIDISSIYPGYRGRADYWRYSANSKTITIVDYKDGWREVSPVRNYELISYAIGIIDSNPEINPDKIIFVIVQPRSRQIQKIKQFCIPVDDLELHREKLKRAAKNAIEGPYKETPGPHCKNCVARCRCAGFNGAVENLFQAYMYSDDPGRDCDVSMRLRFLEYTSMMVAASLSAEQEKAEALIESGESIKGYVLGTGRGSWKFKDVVDEGELKNICAMFGVDAGTWKPRTPTQLKNDGVPEELLNPLTERVSGKKKLKPVDLKEVERLFNNEGGKNV